MNEITLGHSIALCGAPHGLQQNRTCICGSDQNTDAMNENRLRGENLRAGSYKIWRHFFLRWPKSKAFISSLAAQIFFALTRHLILFDFVVGTGPTFLCAWLSGKFFFSLTVHNFACACGGGRGFKTFRTCCWVLIWTLAQYQTQWKDADKPGKLFMVTNTTNFDRKKCKNKSADKSDGQKISKRKEQIQNHSKEWNTSDLRSHVNSRFGEF